MTFVQAIILIVHQKCLEAGLSYLCSNPWYTLWERSFQCHQHVHATLTYTTISTASVRSVVDPINKLKIYTSDGHRFDADKEIGLEAEVGIRRD